MAHWMPLPGTLSGVDDQFTYESLLTTFAKSFAHTYIHRAFNGIGLRLIGSDQPIELVWPEIAARAQAPMVFADYNEWDRVPAGWFSSGWEQADPAMLERSALVTDDEPLLEFFMLRTLQAGGTKMRPNTFWQACVARRALNLYPTIRHHKRRS